MMNGATVGNTLNNRRALSGLSMDELARKMGFAGQSSIQRYLDPDYNLELRPDMARKFDEALVITPKLNGGKHLESETAPPVIAVLKIAASQWTAIPTPDQIIAALEAGGFRIVPAEYVGGAVDALAEAKRDNWLGRRIAELRNMRGLTQEQLSEKLDCHWITVSKLERQEMNLTIEWIARLATALEVTSDELLSRKPTATVDPVAVVNEIIARRGITASLLSKKAGIVPSTLNRALKPGCKFMLSNRTLKKIVEWDNANPTP